MPSLLDDPMVQSGIAPFLVALALAWALSGTRLAWLAVAAGLAATFALSTGIGFSPLSASRKIVLLVLLAPLIGLALDGLRRPNRALPLWLAVACALASVWVFQSVLANTDIPAALALGGGVALFVAVLVGLMLRLRDNGIAAGAATLGLGAAVGVAAILSASLGNMMNGVALAATGGALMLLQLIRGRALTPGWTGTLTVGVAAALFGTSTLVLSKLPWFALALLLLVPLAANVPLYVGRTPRLRLVLLGLTCVAVATIPILAAWLATRFPVS